MYRGYRRLIQKNSWEAGFESVAPFLNLVGTGNSALPSKRRQVLGYNSVESNFIWNCVIKKTHCAIHTVHTQRICSINGGSDVFGTNVEKLYLRDKRFRKKAMSRKWTNRLNLSSDLCSGVYLCVQGHCSTNRRARRKGGTGGGEARAGVSSVCFCMWCRTEIILWIYALTFIFMFYL